MMTIAARANGRSPLMLTWAEKYELQKRLVPEYGPAMHALCMLDEAYSYETAEKVQARMKAELLCARALAMVEARPEPA
jgi:uncharacterized membrane-anchored protein